MRRVTVLGSTGSVGEQALDVVRRFPERLKIYGLAAGSNDEQLVRQAREFSPEVVALADKAAAERLKGQLQDTSVEVLGGEEGVCDLSRRNAASVIIAAISGFAGLKPTMAACQSGGILGLANKESVVCAGALLMDEIRRNSVQMIPVDSEHNAVYQCLAGESSGHLARIILTASGGPFWGMNREQMVSVTPEEALAHPRWDMGKKISVDSATLMNKGLEVIEACWLFDVPVGAVDVVIHPQSAVHSMVQFLDGSIKAHVGPTDMRYPLQHAMSYPDRWDDPGYSDFVLPGLTLGFEAPSEELFPCLKHARNAAAEGGIYPTVLVSADEVAVQAFLDGRITFLQIPDIVETALNEVPTELSSIRDVGITHVLAADEWARAHAWRAVEQ